ncbi:interferon alpha-inducible protein 6 isoform X3 [Delphinapterus leucas]|uniref:Interferon alpha-inducible protein 6 isoform X3 n=1 Tax=Delphinapterus leucas TaxID=9749 RepID=A0A2Y9LR59_DELLE|nr:interferon alpha-inducible protein 6 isoform X3 [Delphinapterus leucas]
MRQKAVSLVLCYLLLNTCSCEETEESDSGFLGTLTYMAVGGGLMAMALPALGFMSTGIAANSVAAKMMSWSAVANGGGVPAGGLVAMLQSLEKPPLTNCPSAFLNPPSSLNSGWQKPKEPAQKDTALLRGGREEDTDQAAPQQ